MKRNLEKGQISPLILWALGFVATSGFGLTIFGFNADARQDAHISEINREVGELGRDIDYIKQGVDQLREAQGIKQSAYASSTNQTLRP